MFEIQEKNENGKVNSYCMMIISKYFNTIHDYINVVKCCKEYSSTITQYKYNPIPFKNRKEREIFSNIEEYHYYNESKYKDNENNNEEEKEIIENDSRIKKYIHWRKMITYSTWKGNDNSKHEYKRIKYGKEDMKKYLLDHE